MPNDNLIRQLRKWTFASGVAVRQALEKGVALRYPIKYYRLHERTVTLLPDMMTEPNSGLSVGQHVRLDHHDRGLTPWGLDHESEKYYRGETIYQITCFAEATLEGRCRITGRFAVLRWVNGNFDLGGISHNGDSGKVYLYWVGLLTTDISDD
jgi:hypothetical protein